SVSASSASGASRVSSTGPALPARRLGTYPSSRGLFTRCFKNVRKARGAGQWSSGRGAGGPGREYGGRTTKDAQLPRFRRGAPPHFRVRTSYFVVRTTYFPYFFHPSISRFHFFASRRKGRKSWNRRSRIS